MFSSNKSSSFWGTIKTCSKLKFSIVSNHILCHCLNEFSHFWVRFPCSTISWKERFILKGLIYRKSKSDEDKDFNRVNKGAGVLNQERRTAVLTVRHPVSWIPETYHSKLTWNANAMFMKWFRVRNCIDDTSKRGCDECSGTCHQCLNNNHRWLDRGHDSATQDFTFAIRTTASASAYIALISTLKRTSLNIF